MPCQCWLNGNFCGFNISYLSHKYNIRILPYNRAQPLCKGNTCFCINLDLTYSFKIIFHRVFNGNNIFIRRVDFWKCSIKSCSFTASCGTCYKDNTIIETYNFIYQSVIFPGEAKPWKFKKISWFIQQSHDHTFAIGCWNCWNSDINFLFTNSNLGSAILGYSFFGNIHAGHNFNSWYQRGLHSFGRSKHFIKNPIDSISHIQNILEWFNMDITCICFYSLGNHVINKPYYWCITCIIKQICSLI